MTVILQDALAKECNEFRKRNDDLSRQKSTEVLTRLHSGMKSKIDSGYYFKPGGYAEYQRDIAKLVKDYMDSPGKGLKVGK